MTIRQKMFITILILICVAYALPVNVIFGGRGAALSQMMNKSYVIHNRIGYLLMFLPVAVMVSAVFQNIITSERISVLNKIMGVGIVVFVIILEYTFFFPSVSAVSVSDLKIKKGEYIYQEGMKLYQGVAVESKGECCVIEWFDGKKRDTVDLQSISFRNMPPLSFQFDYQHHIGVSVVATPSLFGKQQGDMQENFWRNGRPLLQEYLDSLRSHAPILQQKLDKQKLETNADLLKYWQVQQGKLNEGMLQFLQKELKKGKYPFAEFAQVTVAIHSVGGY